MIGTFGTFGTLRPGQSSSLRLIRPRHVTTHPPHPLLDCVLSAGVLVSFLAAYASDFKADYDFFFFPAEHV